MPSGKGSNGPVPVPVAAGAVPVAAGAVPVPVDCVAEARRMKTGQLQRGEATVGLHLAATVPHPKDPESRLTRATEAVAKAPRATGAESQAESATEAVTGAPRATVTEARARAQSPTDAVAKAPRATDAESQAESATEAVTGAPRATVTETRAQSPTDFESPGATVAVVAVKTDLAATATTESTAVVTAVLTVEIRVARSVESAAAREVPAANGQVMLATGIGRRVLGREVDVRVAALVTAGVSTEAHRLQPEARTAGIRASVLPRIAEAGVAGVTKKTNPLPPM